MAFTTSFKPFDFSVAGNNSGAGNGGGNPPGVTSNILADFGASPQQAVRGPTTFGINDKFDANGIQTQEGLANPILSGIGGAFNIYAGLKALGQQEDALDFQKEAFNKNFGANKAAFQENLRSKFSRKKTLGGNKGTTEKEFVDKRSDF